VTSIIAAILVVLLLATALVARRRNVKRAALTGLLITVLAVGALVILVYADPVMHSDGLMGR
jgi:hypothetical protein